MLDREGLTKRLEKALYLTSDVLEQDLITDISVYIHAHEGVIAFEILCSNLYEYELPITRKAYDVLEDIGSQIKTKNEYYEDLKPQIIPDS